MGSVFRTHDAALPRQGGEMARLKVVEGPDLGVTFVVTGTRASLGRAEDNDVFLADLKASRKHAELLYSNGSWSIEDRGSANGIIHNGQVTRQAYVKSGDRLTVGASTLVFVDAHSPLKLLNAPAQSSGAVSADPEQQKALAQQVERVRGAARVSLPKSAPRGGVPKKVNPLLLVAAAGLAWVLLFDDSGTKPKSPGSVKSGASREIAALSDVQPDPSVNRASDIFFKEGFREYREHNWVRARIQFMNALSVYPGHTMAKIYLENSNRQIVDEVQEHLSRGRKSASIGKLREAKGHFEAVMRLLRQESSTPAYVEAKTELAEVLAKISGAPLSSTPMQRAPGGEP